jgi:hypothetical protein
MGGGGANDGLTDSTWGIGSERGSASGVGIFAMRYEFRPSNKSRRKVISVRVCSGPRLVGHVGSSYYLLMLKPVDRELRV